ncbi:hypothetical protein EJ06DRAFT_531830 [Trichodelitschia bisporula]|uniref:Uncharacterized protein n=1 Tax=Trichodelitschia bisporula TaxID=703511 RepID=A0A6G1HSC8_9PEZI|nr:hypothetical protein EJ06DRAFT_531830 [Trichodelitschia bisporula]
MFGPVSFSLTNRQAQPIRAQELGLTLKGSSARVCKASIIKEFNQHLHTKATL